MGCAARRQRRKSSLSIGAMKSVGRVYRGLIEAQAARRRKPKASDKNNDARKGVIGLGKEHLAPAVVGYTGI